MRRFRFESFWINHPEYNDTVKRGWCCKRDCVDANAVSVIISRLKHCTGVLRSWSRRCFPNNGKVIADLKNKISILRQGVWDAQKVEEAALLMN